ncbi:GntR family transcriptional regulator [Enorma sp.]|uniref:GntR family transcriptional regulator n=1 Tax=Enorma sp. TaxID=1920692 RepID=UPI003AB51E0E
MNETLNKGDSEPLYSQVANYIRERIYAQEWGATERIPSEHELMELLGVSRGTVQKGVRALVSEGLLVQRRGKGTFVTKPVVQNPMGNRLLSFAESLRMQGLEFETTVLSAETIDADAASAEHLGIRVGEPIFHLRRVRTVEDVPVVLIESKLNLAACPGLDKLDYSKRTLFSGIELTSHRKIAWGEERYGARVAGATRAKIMGCGECDPLLNIDQVIYLEDGTAVEWGNMWLPANSYVTSSVTQREPNMGGVPEKRPSACLDFGQ